MTPAQQMKAGDLMVTHCRQRLRLAMAEMLAASNEDRARCEFEVERCSKNLNSAELFKASRRPKTAAK